MVRPVRPFGSMADLPRCAPRGLYDRAMASMAAAARVNDADGDLADAYDARGFVSPLRIVAPAVAALALEEVDAFARSQPDGRIRGDLRFKPHLFLPRVAALVRHETVLRAVRAALRTRDVLLWSSDLNIKEPGDGGFFSPHQDATYTGLEPATRGCTLWLALSDPVDARHGCLRFAPGSHVAGQLPHVEAKSPSNLLSRGQRVEAWDASTEVVAALRGGEASIHQLFTVHRSAPNVGDAPRVGLAMRFIAAACVQTKPARESVTAFGQLAHGGFDLEPRLPADPTDADLAAGRAAHADAMRREKANYLPAGAEYT